MDFNFKTMQLSRNAKTALSNPKFITASKLPMKVVKKRMRIVSSQESEIETSKSVQSVLNSVKSKISH